MATPLVPDHATEAEALVDAELGSRHQVRLERSIDVLALPGFGHWDGKQLVGLATFAVDGADAELAGICVRSDHRGRGIGAQLVDAVVAEVESRGVERLWLVTTNDNLVALALYQRHGFRLRELRPGAVDLARASKPSIPEVGASGIPMRDELVLERRLR